MALIELLKRYTFVRTLDTEVSLHKQLQFPLVHINSVKSMICLFIKFSKVVYNLNHPGTPADSYWTHHVTKEWRLSQSGQPFLNLNHNLLYNYLAVTIVCYYTSSVQPFLNSYT